MTCEDCQEKISAFLDNELDAIDSANIRTHLAFCVDCAAVCEDFASILDFCHTEEAHEVLPGNSQAMWCRISNTIESEIQAELIEETRHQLIHREEQLQQAKKSWFSRALSLSFTQAASAVFAIAVVSSFLTYAGIKNYSDKSQADLIASKSVTETTAPNFLDRALGKLGLVEMPEQVRARRVAEQTALVDYWNKRVAQRRALWDANLRAAFDRNLSEIDQAVNEYTVILQENPQDELSTEMLESALTEKVDLLREFSDL